MYGGLPDRRTPSPTRQDRKKLFRQVRPQAPIAGRSVIVTDDGIATGSTMIAALQLVTAQNPRELIVAVRVASPERLDEIRRWCDDVVCLLRSCSKSRVFMP
jgi:putative phosphoribosyl transferase